MIGYVTPGSHDVLKAIELGGANTGDAGPRQDGFFAGYSEGLRSNKLNVICTAQGAE